MLSAIKNFFYTRITSLEKAHAAVTWEEALDDAVFKIGQNPSIETESGKERLGKILDELKLN